MGGNSQAKAQAAMARQQADQFRQLSDRVSKVKLDDAKMEEFYKKRSETLPELVGLYEALQQDPTLMEQLETDPRFDEIARGNLEKIQEIAEQGGFTEEDMAKFREAERKSKAQTAASQKAIDRKMMERGAAPGSGLAYAAKQQALQSDAQSGASRMDQIAMQAAERERNALAQAANMAQGQQQSQFSQMSTKAGAADARNLRNLQAQQSVQDRNLGMRQRMADLKAQNQAGYYDSMAALQQQKFNNEMTKATMQGNLQGQQSQYAMKGVAPRTNWGQIAGMAIGAGLGSFGGPEGATAGAQVGGVVGGAFEDGGIKNKKQALEKMANKPSMNFSGMAPQSEEPSAADQIAAFNSLQRQGRAYSVGGANTMTAGDGASGTAATSASSDSSSSDSKGKKDSQMLDIISALASNLNSAKEQAAPVDIKPMEMRTEQPNNVLTQQTPMGGISAANGGVRRAFNMGGSQMTAADSGDVSMSPQEEYEQMMMRNNPEKIENKSAEKIREIRRTNELMGRDRNHGISGAEERQAFMNSEPVKSVTGFLNNLFSSEPEKQEYKPSELDGSHEYDTAQKLKQQGVKDESGDIPKSAYTAEERKKLEEKADGKKKEGSQVADALGAIAKGLGGSGAGKAPAETAIKPLNMQVNMPQNVLSKQVPMGGIMANDGAVKMSPEDMRDMLMSEVNAFACGGVKKDYEDGGISPELREATQMLRTNKPAPASPMPGGQPPMPADPNMMPPQAPQGAPMAPPMDPNMMPPQGAPMPPQGQMMADGGMAYEDGGEGTIIPGESYEGDELPDRINSGEMVLNVEQQDRLNDQLQELKRLKSKERTDKMLADGTAEVNPEQQEAIMSFVRGEIDIDELPSERVVKEPSVGEPTGRMAEFIGMLGKKRRG